jgi:hypothetical protein
MDVLADQEAGGYLLRQRMSSVICIAAIIEDAVKEQSSLGWINLDRINAKHRRGELLVLEHTVIAGNHYVTRAAQCVLALH